MKNKASAAVVDDEDAGQVSRPRTVSPRPASTVGSLPGRRRPSRTARPASSPLLVRPCRAGTVTEDAVHDQGLAPASAAGARRGPFRGGGPRLPSSAPASRAGAAAVALERDRLDAVIAELLFIGDAAERGELGQVRGEGGVLDSAAVEPGRRAAERDGADAPFAPGASATAARAPVVGPATRGTISRRSTPTTTTSTAC